jgi:hypothetical protein
MDPLSALGVAAAVVEFVDFGAEIISTAREICESSVGATKRNSTYEITVSEFEQLSKKLTAPGNVQAQSQYPNLCQLVRKLEV